jgi:hypothetical protein
MRTGRSRTSGENFGGFFMTPSSQELEPPQNLGRFTHCRPAETPAPRQPQPEPVCGALERGVMFLKCKISDTFIELCRCKRHEFPLCRYFKKMKTCFIDVSSVAT